MVAMKGKAELVSDADVVQLLLSTLLEPKYQNGVLVDGEFMIPSFQKPSSELT